MTTATAEQIQPTLKLTPEDLLAGSIELVSLPDIYLRVRGVIEDQESSMADLARVVSNDPALTARLLKLANSAFFGFTNRIDTIERATNLLGSQQIHDLVLATTVADAFAKISPHTVTLHDFWCDSVHAALLAKLLGSACGIVDAERFFVQGLLHKIGLLLLDQSVPDACAAVVARAREEQRPAWLIERQQIGCDSAAVGATLMARWHFPANLIEAVRHQNEPQLATQHPLDGALLHAAVVMLSAERGGLDDTWAFRTVNTEAADVLGLDETIVSAVRADAAGALNETFELLFPQHEGSA